MDGSMRQVVTFAKQSFHLAYTNTILVNHLIVQQTLFAQRKNLRVSGLVGGGALPLNTEQINDHYILQLLH